MSGLPLFTAAMNTPPEANVAYRRFFTARDPMRRTPTSAYFGRCGAPAGASRMARHRAPSLRVIEHLRQVLDAGAGAEVAYLRAA